jgi:adenylate kinase
MRLVLLGPPGAGKSTQAEIIAHTFNIPHVSPGNILREEIREGTSLGTMVKAYVEKGDLVPDDQVIGLVEKRLARRDAGKGFVLEGFPRSLSQAEALERFLEERDLRLDAVIDIQVSERLIMMRISGRRTCRSCGASYNIYYYPPHIPGICDVCGGRLHQRADDSEEAVRNRIEVYDTRTLPLLEYYRKQDILITIDGDKEVDQVRREIMHSLEMKITQ